MIARDLTSVELRGPWRDSRCRWGIMTMLGAFDCQSAAIFLSTIIWARSKLGIFAALAYFTIARETWSPGALGTIGPFPGSRDFIAAGQSALFS